MQHRIRDAAKSSMQSTSETSIFPTSPTKTRPSNLVAYNLASDPKMPSITTGARISSSKSKGEPYMEMSPNSNGRKRRKLSPPDSESTSSDENDSHVAPQLTASRIKAKQQGVPPSTGLSTEAAADAERESSTFADLGVVPWLSMSLSAMAIRKPTGIQRGCIPEILKGRDCIGGSRTGSGKTVAFAVPILQKWSEDPYGIYAVVLTPTRELALQIFEQFKAISAPQSLKPILVTGGADMRNQAIELSRRPHVVIATPGRLADHVHNSGEDTIGGLRRARFIVLDEADRLLASGHGSMLPDVETCMSVLPPSSERQTCLFTATVTEEVRALKEMPRSAKKPPVFVCEVDTERLAIPTTLQQMYLQVQVTHQLEYLHILLLTPRNVERSLIVFCNRTKTADILERTLRTLEHRVTSLHSGLPQSERTANLARFRAKAARIMIATDVASRGLDIPDVELVINYDVPRDPDSYIHRVGRTARAGRKGEAVTFVGQRDVDLIMAIEARVGRKMVEYEEEGVNVETRVVRDALKPVGKAKREVMIDIDENRDVKGKRKKGMQKLNRV